MFTSEELAIIAEAIEARIDSDFHNADVEGDMQILSPAHEAALIELQAKIEDLRDATPIFSL